MFSQQFSRLKLSHVLSYQPRVFMAAQSRKDFEAIQIYNKLRKKPVTSDQTYCQSELKQIKKIFDKVLEIRKQSEAGFTPSKLFMVWRIASLVGRPMWEKETIIKLGLAHPKVKYAIVKNTASNNEVLWTVKHLIRVKPIEFPDGFPTEEDLYSTYLKQNGELLIDSRLHVDSAELEQDEEFKLKTLDQRTNREDMRIMWNKSYPKMY